MSVVAQWLQRSWVKQPKIKDWQVTLEKQKNVIHARILGSQKGGIFKGPGPDMKNTVTLSWDWGNITSSLKRCFVTLYVYVCG